MLNNVQECVPQIEHKLGRNGFHGNQEMTHYFTLTFTLTLTLNQSLTHPLVHIQGTL